jgi:deoxyribonuclease-4
MPQHHKLLLGAHMSTAGGLEQALLRGASIHCTTIQLFTKSNRQWKARPITHQEAQLFRETAALVNIHSIVAHAAYIINLGTPEHEAGIQSSHAVKIELERCHQLGINYLVLHPGAHLQTPLHDCLERIAQRINTIFDTTESDTILLLENMAGQGSSVCFTFEQIATIISLIHNKKRIGVCFDTCHAFAAGYTFNTPETYQAMWTDFDKTIGFQHLKAIHLNDSKKACGSRVDRHEEIGQGAIGLEGFRLLMNDPRLFAIAKILETPKDDLPHYAQGMRLLTSLLTAKNRDVLGVEGGDYELKVIE